MPQESSRRDFLRTTAAVVTGTLASPHVHAQVLPPEQLRIASTGTPQATIVVASKSGRTMRFAASELQKYIERMTGARLPIEADTANINGCRIALSSPTSPNVQIAQPFDEGRTPSDNSDAFRLRTMGNLLVVAGASDRAVLFAVYALLERWGCRWFGPGEEFVPQVESLVLAQLDEVEKPSFRWRALELIAGSSPQVVDWMAKARLNVAWPEQYVPNPDLTVSEASLVRAAVPEMLDRGLTIFWGGHVLPQLFSSETYKDHPEYFAEIKGQRLDPAVDFQIRTQLCTSHPDVLPLLARNTVKFLQNHSWIDTLFLWGNDTPEWCQCSSCRELEAQPEKPTAFGGPDRSATYCRMVRAVSDEVNRQLPGRKIGFNHYYNCEDLPRDANGAVRGDVLPDAQAVVSAVDDYRQCDRHPFGDANCPKGKRIAPLARLWSPYYRDAISWSYYWSWNFMKGLPISMVNKIPDDFRMLESLGIQGMIDNVSLSPGNLMWMNNRLNLHVYARAGWDPHLDVAAVMDDYIRNYYGPAVGPLSEFWKLMEDDTRQFGNADLVPTDLALAKPAVVHGWLLSVKGLIPHRAAYDRALKSLNDGLAAVSEADGRQLKREHRLYAFRIQALKSAVEAWDPPTRNFHIFGYLNGGGHNVSHLYAFQDGIEGSISCSVVGGTNVGDCFWPTPLGAEQLGVVGDVVKLKVQVNYGAETAGEPTYRSGPGLYQAHDQSSPCGKEQASSVIFVLGNVADEKSGGRCVLLSVNDGKYGTDMKVSAENTWHYGQEVALRITYTSAQGGAHTYRYEYDAGAGWVEVGTVTLQRKLAFAAPMHHWAGGSYGQHARYPLIDWAVCRGFSARNTILP